MVNNLSLNFIRLIRVVITPSVTTLLRRENDSKLSDEIQAKTTFASPKERPNRVLSRVRRFAYSYMK